MRSLCFSQVFFPRIIGSYMMIKRYQLKRLKQFFKHFIYLFMRGTERERQRHRQREKQAPFREPDVRLDSGTPGSRPELKADAPNHWATQTSLWFLISNTDISHVGPQIISYPFQVLLHLLSSSRAASILVLEIKSSINITISEWVTKMS